MPLSTFLRGRRVRLGREGVLPPALLQLLDALDVVVLAQGRFPAAIEAGTQERGAKLDDAARTWAVQLTDKLLDFEKGDSDEQK